MHITKQTPSLSLNCGADYETLQRESSDMEVIHFLAFFPRSSVVSVLMSLIEKIFIVLYKGTTYIVPGTAHLPIFRTAVAQSIGT